MRFITFILSSAIALTCIPAFASAASKTLSRQASAQPAPHTRVTRTATSAVDCVFKQLAARAPAAPRTSHLNGAVSLFGQRKSCLIARRYSFFLFPPKCDGGHRSCVGSALEFSPVSEC